MAAPGASGVSPSRSAGAGGTGTSLGLAALTAAFFLGTAFEAERFLQTVRMSRSFAEEVRFEADGFFDAESGSLHVLTMVTSGCAAAGTFVTFG